MTRTLAFLLALGFLSACSEGNPLVAADDSTTTEDDDDTTTGISSDRDLPPGTSTTNASPNNQIVRYEAEDSSTGGGYARTITYSNDAGQDEFSVDNLAFDGDNTYLRGGTTNAANAIGQLGSFAVYEADQTTTDTQTGNVIGTFDYRAIYGRSTTGSTEFAIVRTGSYVPYGFGGFIYQRNETDDNGDQVELVLPTTGDAEYTGDYAGIRVYDGTTGMNYVTGDARLLIDFKDFNDSQRGVALFISNRRMFSLDGVDVTSAYLAAYETTNTKTLTRSYDSSGNVLLPGVSPEISPDVADENGEIVQNLQSYHVETDGTVTESGSGTYYAIISGTDADEIVGVAVTTGDNGWVDNTTYQETGGFIIYRQ